MATHVGVESMAVYGTAPSRGSSCSGACGFPRRIVDGTTCGVWVVNFSANTQAKKSSSVAAKPYAGAPTSDDSLTQKALARAALSKSEHGTRTRIRPLPRGTTIQRTRSVMFALVTAANSVSWHCLFVWRVCESKTM